jgi:ABC-2 type transport system ATP-binding protein
VGIMAALFGEPQTVILDEPFNFLDPTSQNQLKHLLTNYQQRTGATVIISSHNLQHTIDISTRIVVLEHGNIVMDGADREELEAYFQV